MKKNVSLIFLIAAISISSMITNVSSKPHAYCPPHLEFQSLSAHNRCRFPNFFLPELLTPSKIIESASLDESDLNVTHIMQTPRYDYDNPAKSQHNPGDLVTFKATVANRGNQSTGSFDYQWYIDDIPVSGGTGSNLAPSQTTTFNGSTQICGARSATGTLHEDL